VAGFHTIAARTASLIVVLGIVTGCGLPRTGPTKAEIFSGAVQREGDSFVVEVDDRVTRATAVAPALGFGGGFADAGMVGSDTIQPGDVLALQIWENVDDGLLVAAGTPNTVLEQVQVDGQGFIFVPYAGRIQAAGNTPEALRQLITERLSEQTPDPQVTVTRAAGDGATVSVAGAVGAQGVYAIERPTRTLAAMLARAGGVSVEPEIAQVKVIRGSHTGTIWFNDLFRNPGADIALRPGDRILVEADTRAYTALGATGVQRRVPFESQQLTALEAIAQVGGLSPAAADPTGIFVFRNEPEPVAREVLGRDDLVGDQRLVYLLDLSQPNGVFLARDFVIRDGDTVYVTEAPYTQFSKVVGALLTPLNAAASVQTLGN
jgi:polysaccharide export outer membrane protein